MHNLRRARESEWQPDGADAPIDVKLHLSKAEPALYVLPAQWRESPSADPW